MHKAFLQLHHNLEQYHSPMPEFAHLVIGFESANLNNTQDFVTASLLNTMMGGGVSFSAGGPGKGMYSRLCLNILNKFVFVLLPLAFLTYILILVFIVFYIVFYFFIVIFRAYFSLFTYVIVIFFWKVNCQ